MTDERDTRLRVEATPEGGWVLMAGDRPVAMHPLDGRRYLWRDGAWVAWEDPATEDRLAAIEARLAALEAEVARLRALVEGSG